MLRWCRPPFHISRGYGASRTHPTRSQDASQLGFLLGPSTSKHETSPRTYSAQSIAVARDAPDERTSTRHSSSFLYQYNTELSQILPLGLAWSPSVPDASLNLPRPTASSKQLNHSPNSLHLQTSPTHRRPSITSRKVGHNSRKIATSQSSQRQPSDANVGVTLSRYLQRSRLRGIACSEIMIDEMVNLYSSCQSRKLLHELSARDFETLLTICGRYSSPALQWSQLPQEVRVTSKPGRSGKVYWRFILEVVKDRESVSGGQLTNVERFWRLNGLLHLLSNGIRSEAQMADTIRQVNEDYLALRRLIANESFYLAYFRTTLATGPKFQNAQVLNHFCDYLERFSRPSFSLLETFWGALLTGRLDGTPSLQARVLNFVSARLSEAIPKTSHTPQPDNLEPTDGSREILTVHALSEYFASAIFPCYRTEQSPNFLLRWTFKETREAFSSTLPHDLRWSGLVLLAKNMMKSSRFRPVPSPHDTPPTTIRWQTILFLSGVETTLERLDSTDLSTPEAKSYLRTVSNTLWRNWLQAESLQCPIDVKRAVISSFLKIAAAGANESLFTECSRYCTNHKLWHWSPDGSLARQALGLVATYAYTLGECQHLQVPQVFDHIIALIPDRTSVNGVASLLLPLFLAHDVDRAHEILLFARANGVEVSLEAVVSLVVALSHDQQWDAAVSTLRDYEFSDKQRENILIAILRIFQTSRYQTLDKTLAETLGHSLFQLYSTINPSPISKYPVRYFLGLLIAADHGRLAVDILDRLFLTTPSFFTQRRIREWVVQLVQKGLPTQAGRLFKLSRHHFTLAQSIDLQRKLTTALFAANALGHARKIVGNLMPRRTRPTRRDRMLRITVCRTKSRDRRHTFKVMGLMNHNRRASPSTIQTAVTILVRQGRLYAARKLFLRHSARLDTKISTVIGNTILHGYVYFRGSNTGNVLFRGSNTPRAIRHIFHMKDMLSEGTKFTVDRTTFNILVKAILNSKKRLVNPERLRALFDHVVRLGYPVSERWRRENGVPFSTDAGSADLPPWVDQLPPVDQPISFVKHVQPLYKMFIKGFYLDEDRSAAKCVVGILKEEKLLDRERVEARSRSIREGVIRKKARERGGFLEEGI